jgi:membrane associated rhomboid family serine protease
MAFFHEQERQPFVRVPAVTAGLIAVLIVAHVARVLAPPETSQAILYNYGFYPARYSHAFLIAHGAAPQTFLEQAIPFVSYIFLHANFAHLALNCIWLLPFGSIVARRFGTLTFLLFFLVCGIAGAATHLATHWEGAGTIGASAAISGLMAAGFRIVALVEAPDLESYSAAVSGDIRLHRPLAPILSQRILVWTAIWTAINVVFGLTGLGAGVGPGPELIAWQAHIGGYFAGLLLAGPFDALARRLAP